MNINNRRPPSRKTHELYVRVHEGQLQVRCKCGLVVGGQRYEDRERVSLSDLLELVRIHSKEYL